MKRTRHYISVFVFLGVVFLLAMQCKPKGGTSAEDTAREYYFSINKNNYTGTNPGMIAGWADKKDFEKQIIEEFQGEIQNIFKQHQGLQEVKTVTTTPGATASETTLNVELVCTDGHTEAVTLQMTKEGENWKVVQ
ncbi:MAG: hypothetical protein NT175_02110 [Bacteroidetes bacterium]|nr:hypothetical protein [Bacteroidota bacterium]